MQEKKIDSKQIFKGKILDVYLDHAELDNKIVTREVIRHPGGVCIYGEIDDKVLLVKQFRYPFNQELLELPAGKLEKAEDPYQAALREFQEETGYQAQRLISLGEFYPTCAYDDEVIHLYQAKDLKYVGANLDEGEYLKVLSIDKQKLKEKILSNQLPDGKTQVLCLKVWANE
ncbi:MAG: NUDIX domain-containing protein [Erysipelotrichaceae bacterium]